MKLFDRIKLTIKVSTLVFYLKPKKTPLARLHLQSRIATVDTAVGSS